MKIIPQILAKDLGTLVGEGPLGTDLISDKNAQPTLDRFSTLISWLIGFMTIGGGIYLIFQIILGAYEFLGSENDKARIQRAQKKIVNAIFGFIILTAAYGLIALLGYVLGINILDPAATLLDIWKP